MLTIGEFSKLCRVSSKTLRHYDNINLIKPKHINDENGYRFYDVSQLRDMIFIDKLKRYRFSLSEIAVMLYAKDSSLLCDAIKNKKKEFIIDFEEQNHILKLMESDISKLERSIDIMKNNYEVKLIETEPMNVASVRKMMGVKDFDSAYGELMGMVYRNKYTITGPSFSLYHTRDFNPENSDIEVGVMVAETGGENIRVLDCGLCAYVTYIGRYNEVSPAYAALMEFMEKEGYDFSYPPYEKYIKGPRDNVSPDEFVSEIYFPVKKI